MTRRHLGAFSLAALLAAGSVWADDKPNPATKPAPRQMPFWMQRHERFVERAKKGDVDVLFLGDSITQGWENAGKDVWKERYEPLRAANFGIGGDQTQHVLWRITEGKELDGIKPKVAVLMIGTNNAGGMSPDQIADGVAAIVKALREARPEMKILLLGVFPRSAKPGAQLKDVTSVPKAELHPKIPEINQRIAKLADGDKVVYLDIGDKFLGKDGELSKEIMPDFLHLSKKGYEIWADAIQEPLAKMLGK